MNLNFAVTPLLYFKKAVCWAKECHMLTAIPLSPLLYSIHKKFALLGYYTTSSGNSLPMTFQDNQLVPSSRETNPRRKLVIHICSLNSEGSRWCIVLSSAVPAGDAGGRGVGVV